MKSKILTAAALFSVPFLSISTVNAHEIREGVSGAFNLIVGQRAEPAHTGEPNQFDLFVRNLDGTPAAVTEIDLDVDVLFLEDDQYDAVILHRAPLGGELLRDREIPNRYGIHFMPTKAGAYGFEVNGTINGIQISEKFVCEDGSLSPNRETYIGCVRPIQEFPKKKALTDNQ